MENFCGSPFWDQNVTWNTDKPDFTLCSQETVLVWVPCVFLWLFAPLDIYLNYKQKSGPNPWTFLTITKIFLTFLLAILALVEMVYSMVLYSDGEPVNPSYYYASFVKILCYMLVAFLLNVSRQKGAHTSGTLFVFWLLFCCKEIITYRSALLMTFQDSIPYSQSPDKIKFIIITCTLPLVLGQVILFCFADPKTTYHAKKASPEESASFLSQITYWWFTSMAVKGHRQPLVMDDMWPLNSKNQTESIMQLFEKYWIPLSSQIQRKKNVPDNTDGLQIEIVDRPKTVAKPKLSAFMPLVKTFKWELIFSALFKLIGTLLAFISPIVLNMLITFVASDEPYWRGFFYAGILFVSSMLESLFNNQHEYMIYCIGMKVRSALSTTIFKKALVLSNSARRNYTVGEIVNLMSVDIQRILDTIHICHTLWAAPLQIFMSLYMLWQQIGVSTLGGLVVLILLIPFHAICSVKIRKMQIDVMKTKGKRTHLMNEVLNGIKVLKLYSWEESFQKSVSKLRDLEVKVLTKQCYVSSFITFLFTASPFVVALASFAMFVLIDSSNVLDANKAFVSLSLFNILRAPFALFPIIVIYTAMFFVSLNRLNAFLSSREIDPSAVTKEKTADHQVLIRNGSFSWGEESEPLLKGVNFSPTPGSLVAIVGTVGSGKSSLLSALLGEMEKNEGTVNVVGSVSYVPQQAWIQNSSLRQNIIFTNPLKESRYKKVLENCCLNPDLEILPGGDMTEIGEKGINLSGGQKQRVSLARAVYNDADVYLFDDPLSAVDAHVSKELFDKVIGPNGMLKKKTRILVTHRITVLPECDSIIVLKNGIISEEGSYEQLLLQKGAFADFLLQHISQNYQDDDVVSAEELQLIGEIADSVGSTELKRQVSQLSASDSESFHSGSEKMRSSSPKFSSQISQIDRMNSVDGSKHRPPSPISQTRGPSVSKEIPKLLDNKNKSKLVDEETVEVGTVKWSIYLKYMKACGFWSSISIAFYFIASNAFNIASSIWLSAWSNDATIPGSANDTDLRNVRIGVYAALGTGESIFNFVSTIVLALCTLRASRTLHEQCLDHVLRAPMSFFDTTPLGRILNRFSKDVDSMDTVLRFNLRLVLISFFRAVSVIVIISLQTAFMLLVFIPVGVLYHYVQVFYVSTSRQLKRLESITRSPIFTHFSEAISGM